MALWRGNVWHYCRTQNHFRIQEPELFLTIQDIVATPLSIALKNIYICFWTKRGRKSNVNVDKTQFPLFRTMYSNIMTCSFIFQSYYKCLIQSFLIWKMAPQNICLFPFAWLICLFVQKCDGAHGTCSVHLCDPDGSWDDVKWNRLLADIIKGCLIRLERADMERY